MPRHDGEPLNDWLDAETRVERAHDLYEEGRWAEAAAELQAAIAINPYNAAWHFNLALTFEVMEDYAQACKAYRSSLALSPNDVETLNCLGVSLTRLGQYSEALGSFEAISRLDAAHEPAYCNRIVTYCELGQHDKAEVMFYMAQQIKVDCPLCFYNMGNSLYARSDYRRAIYCWTRTLEIDPGHPYAHARIAEARWAEGDLAGAAEQFAAELDVSGGDPDIWVDYAELLSELEKYDQAEQCCRKALELEPDHTAANYCLGELALVRNRPAIAEQHFRHVLKAEQDYPGIHAKLAEALIRRGRIQQAAKHLVTEMRRSGDDPVMLQELGQLLLEAHLSRHANGVLRRLVDLSPDDPCAQHNLAVSFFRMHRIDEGIRHCRKALKLKPEYPLALYNLALAHIQKGQIQRARRYAAKALTLSPNDEHLRRLSERLGGVSFWTKVRARLNGRRNNRKIPD